MHVGNSDTINNILSNYAVRGNNLDMLSGYFNSLIHSMNNAGPIIVPRETLVVILSFEMLCTFCNYCYTIR